MIKHSLFFVLVIFYISANSEQHIKVRLFSLDKIIKFEIIPLSTDLKLKMNATTIKIHNSIIITKERNFLKVQDEKSAQTEEVYLFNNNNKTCKFKLLINNKKREYEGFLKVNVENDEIICILETSKNYYIKSVLASETNASDNPEFKKSLALIIKNNIDSRKSLNHISYDYCDNTHCQLFWGDTKISIHDELAVKKIKDLFLSFKNERVFLNYSACCGGRTLNTFDIWENSNQKISASVQCSFCSTHKFFNWKREFNVTKFEKLFNLTRENIQFINDQNYSIEIITSKNSFLIKKDKLRIEFGKLYGWNFILSNRFKIFLMEKKIIIKGNGFGHNVGFCVEGAKTLAKKNKNFKEILFHYFPYIYIYENKNKENN